MSSPQTKIRICQSLGLSNDYRHTFWFDNVAEQTEFFESKVIKTFTDYAYVRKNWSLKVGAKITDAERWGYLFFQNFPTGRYYYYFITNVKYISDETVELELELDVMQTYLFDYALQPCFVEREHSATDNIGDNTLEEDVELGLLKNNTRLTPDVFNGTMSVLVMSNVTLNYFDAEGNPVYNRALGGLYDGVYSGCNLYRYTSDDLLDLLGTLLNLEKAGKSDAIVAMWHFPEGLIETNDYDEVKSAKIAGVDFSAVTRPNTIDGYTPKNKKLLTYPYCYIYATNNSGNSAIYRYERFADSAIDFVIEGSVFLDGGVKFTPKNYNGTGFNYDESLTLTGFPTCAWNSDTYKIWLAQNQAQHATQAIVSVGAVAGGVAMLATGNVLGGAGGIAGGVSGIASLLAQRADMEKQPPQARGQVSSTLNTAIGQQAITVYQKSITRERAEIIDNFFTMFGYKTLRVKTPNRNVRTSFTYTKTQGCLLTGALCQEDARKIQSIYDNGVTFWQKNVAIGNYSASNAVK